MASIREKSPKTEYSVLVLCVFRSAENGLQGGPNQMIKVGQFRIAKSALFHCSVPLLREEYSEPLWKSARDLTGALNGAPETSVNAATTYLANVCPGLTFYSVRLVRR